MQAAGSFARSTIAVARGSLRVVPLFTWRAENALNSVLHARKDECVTVQRNANVGFNFPWSLTLSDANIGFKICAKFA